MADILNQPPMISVNLSPSAQTVSIEHLPDGRDLALTPEQAYSVYQRLKERSSDRALELLNFLAQQRNSVLDLVAEKNRKAQDAEGCDTN